MTPGPPPEVPDEIALLRECQDRALDREGIPMILTLVSEVGPMPPVQEADVVRSGERLGAEMDRVRAVLAPSGRDEDMGRLITVLQAVSYADFGRLDPA